MRVRGNPRNGETAMFPRAVWTRARCPVASGMSGVSAIDKTSQFRGYSACIPYNSPSIVICVEDVPHMYSFRMHPLALVLVLLCVGALSSHLHSLRAWHLCAAHSSKYFTLDKTKLCIIRKTSVSYCCHKVKNDRTYRSTAVASRSDSGCAGRDARRVRR